MEANLSDCIHNTKHGVGCLAAGDGEFGVIGGLELVCHGSKRSAELLHPKGKKKVVMNYMRL